MVNIEQSILDRAIRVYGEKPQMLMCVEEMAELQKEILKNVNRGKQNKFDIIDEVADVLITIESVKSVMSITDEDLQTAINRKLWRLIERMNNKESME